MPQPVLSVPVPLAPLSPLAHPVAEDRPLDSRLFDREGVDMSDIPWIGTSSPTEDVGAGWVTVLGSAGPGLVMAGAGDAAPALEAPAPEAPAPAAPAPAVPAPAAPPLVCAATIAGLASRTAPASRILPRMPLIFASCLLFQVMKPNVDPDAPFPPNPKALTALAAHASTEA